MYKSPVAYVVFNRPEYTRRSFNTIREYQPEKLFLIADGPRKNIPEDSEKCEAVRRIVEKIDWKCEVYKKFANKNLGLKKNVSEGLSWVFDQSDTAIVLEDDCIPHKDFYRFCNIMLDRYKNDDRVMVITGNNFQNGKHRGPASYYFSKYNHCWGWASWKSAWMHYDGNLDFWPQWSNSTKWAAYPFSRKERTYWERIFDNVRSGNINSWAYPWTASVWRLGGLTVTPNVNLVSNIGFGEDATNTTSKFGSYNPILTDPLGIITHPTEVCQNLDADRYVFANHFRGSRLSLLRRAFSHSLKIIKRITKPG